MENGGKQVQLFGQVREIYSLFRDEESQYIFRQRLLYSLSGDNGHIWGMAAALSEKYGDKDAIFLLRRWLKQQMGKIPVIFGTGCACRHILQILRYYGEEKIGYLCDNKRESWGKQYYGKEVLEPEKLKSLKGGICIIVGTNWYQDEIFNQLCSMGIEQEDIFTPPRAWWLGEKAQYFDPEIMVPNPHEVFVDGGAFMGEDTREFARWCGNTYDTVLMFEPDRANYEKLHARMEAFADRRNSVLNCGLWSSETDLRFSAERSSNSRMDSQGTTTVHVAALDGILEGPVTFIKMDIEGAEMEALKGAANTIQKYKPKLAICVYHKPEDILDIPRYIYGLRQDYRFYLRHYSYSPTETVLYAV